MSALHLLKKLSPAHAQKWSLLHMSNSNIFTVYNSSSIFKILPNAFDPPEMVKRPVQALWRLGKWAPDYKIKFTWVS